MMKGFGRIAALLATGLVLLLMLAAPAAVMAQQPEGQPGAKARRGGEANLVLPDLGTVDVGGYDGRMLLFIGLGVSALGILFGLVILNQLKNLPVHRSMREISELIYETCKTYLVTQGDSSPSSRFSSPSSSCCISVCWSGWSSFASPSFCSSASSAFSAATAWRGSGFA